MIKRQLLEKLKHTLSRGRSILLFGPRQVGKTTLAKLIDHDWYITFMDPGTRQQYEKSPGSLVGEVKALSADKKPLIIIDEVQKVPQIMDSIQVLIDDNIAQFIITGSSARKIKNLLPGRVIRHSLYPCTQVEFQTEDIAKTLVNGTLPRILTTNTQADIEEELSSYVSVYLEEEIRKEALVRNLAAFSQFLQLACIESGNLVSLRKLSQEIGVAHTTIAEYYNILEDCMLVERFDPITKSKTRKRLTKSSKYIIFDLGVRRLGALEGDVQNLSALAHLFEQWVGLELKRMSTTQTQVQFWRDHAGPEVDWVLVKEGEHTPIEVKWTEAPTMKDARHLHTFQKEYPSTEGYIICRVKKACRISDNVVALPWRDIANVFEAKKFN